MALVIISLFEVVYRIGLCKSAHNERKYSRFIDGLIGDAQYCNLLLAHLSHIS